MVPKWGYCQNLVNRNPLHCSIGFSRVGKDLYNEYANQDLKETKDNIKVLKAKKAKGKYFETPVIKLVKHPKIEANTGVNIVTGDQFKCAFEEKPSLSHPKEGKKDLEKPVTFCNTSLSHLLKYPSKKKPNFNLSSENEPIFHKTTKIQNYTFKHDKYRSNLECDFNLSYFSEISHKDSGCKERSRYKYKNTGRVTKPRLVNHNKNLFIQAPKRGKRRKKY
ncbi:unnamed protein product [Moneuplotes crassus]|uniref:Uncharacterized protein n=1 Tax=Euplotes crassus TaxID=5936 RepID=A0AAD1XD08_EUPCR|nr:unnamed protein product [Moneuplotes crassus]